MQQCRCLSYTDREAVVRVLVEHHQGAYSQTDCEAIATAIMPYLARTRLMSFEAAVVRIARNYEQYGATVARLLDSPDAPEWDDVLIWVIDFACQHARYPRDTEAVSAPDLDAYDDIREKLPSYNFEGSLRSWLTTTVLNRITRYWRDRQTITAGGEGIKTRAERSTEAHMLRTSRAANRSLVSFEYLLEYDAERAGRFASTTDSVAEQAEIAELRRIVDEELRLLAKRKNDPLLPHVWRSVVEQGLKLRECGDLYGLTISQVHRRVELVRGHLRSCPQIVCWHQARLL